MQWSRKNKPLQRLPNVAVRISGGVNALSNVSSFRASSDFSFQEVKWGFTSMAATTEPNMAETVTMKTKQLSWVHDWAVS